MCCDSPFIILIPAGFRIAISRMLITFLPRTTLVLAPNSCHSVISSLLLA